MTTMTEWGESPILTTREEGEEREREGGGEEFTHFDSKQYTCITYCSPFFDSLLTSVFAFLKVGGKLSVIVTDSG